MANGPVTIVDSSAWVDYFNGAHTPHTERLHGALRNEEDIGVVPIVVTEVLQGFRTEAGFRNARRALLQLPVVHPRVDGYVRAAALFRSLRALGVTVRGAVDCVIAQICMDLDAELLSPDTDFELIARHTSLRLWRTA